jgi:proline-specific peptidase
MNSNAGTAASLSKTLPAPSKTEQVAFKVPGTDIEAKTWYALYGELSEDVAPLVCLHGGPGMAHNYILPCAHLSSAPFSRPVILYDQIGCGNSTHLRERKGDTDFWTADLFIAELENLLSHLGIKKFDLFGQSWGGMLGATYAARRPAGLYRLIIANSPASLITWVDVANQLRKELPKDIQETLTRCEEEGSTDSDEYEHAMMAFYVKHVCRVVPFPDGLMQTLAQVKEDDTVYMTM